MITCMVGFYIDFVLFTDWSKSFYYMPQGVGTERCFVIFLSIGVLDYLNCLGDMPQHKSIDTKKV